MNLCGQRENPLPQVEVVACDACAACDGRSAELVASGASVVRHATFGAAFGGLSTPLDEGLWRTVAWCRDQLWAGPTEAAHP